MKRILIKFEGSPVQYFLEYDSKKHILKNGDYVVVNSNSGLQLAEILSEKAENYKKIDSMTFEEAVDNMDDNVFSFVRIATKEDHKIYSENKIFSKSAKLSIKKIVKKHCLEMKISDVIINLDKTKIIIYFTSENRVDFRELVKELATFFKARIELKQIGSRDEARIKGGIGPCGQQCCCKRFLTDFGHVSIKMAKNQNLSLNPNKISGVCGRLLCCLSYENDYYVEMLKTMPKVNSIISTPEGKGVVMFNDLQKQTTQVKIGDSNNFEIKTFKLEELRNKKG